MAIRVQYPDGNRENLVPSSVDVQGEWEVEVREDEYGLSFVIKNLAEVSSSNEFLAPDVVSTTRLDINFDEHDSPLILSQDSNSKDEFIGSGVMAAGVAGPSLMQRWKRPGPCNLLFMIGEAWQVGRIFTGAVDKSQQSDDFYRGFDEDGLPILESKTQIGFFADPVAKLVALDVARRFLGWKVSFCRFREPPDKPEKQVETAEAVAVEATTEVAVAPVEAPVKPLGETEMVSVDTNYARGLLMLYNGSNDLAFGTVDQTTIPVLDKLSGIFHLPLFANPQSIFAPLKVPAFKPVPVFKPIRVFIPKAI